MIALDQTEAHRVLTRHLIRLVWLHTLFAGAPTVTKIVNDLGVEISERAVSNVIKELNQADDPWVTSHEEIQAAAAAVEILGDDHELISAFRRWAQSDQPYDLRGRAIRRKPRTNGKKLHL